MDKTPKNPAQAYLKGYDKGRKQGYQDAFITFAYAMLPAMYNAKNDRKLSDKYFFEEYAKKVQEELQSTLDSVFGGDVIKMRDIVLNDTTSETVDDKAKYFMAKVNELRKKCGMEGI